jgi:hypothetical protein
VTGTVYALLVGINDYLPPVNALYGCRNDVRNVEQFLRARIGERLAVTTLLDAEATRANVIDAFRTHLGQATEGDVALFVFDGHGTEEPAPPELAALEPSGRLQVLVCVDSGRRVEGRLTRGIADKELALLIREVAARGPHVTVILDCCHSGSGTRDRHGSIRQWLPLASMARPEERELVLELAAPRPLDSFLPGAVADWVQLPRVIDRDSAPGAASNGAPGADHVALSACQSFQVAKEHASGTEVTGVFSHAVLAAMEAVGPEATYRELLATVRSRVEQATAEQTPVLYPVTPGGPCDGLVLDGTVRRSTPAFLITAGARGYEVDAGLVHGLREPSGDEHFELTCTTLGGEVAGQVKVTDVDIGRSRVEPIGWTPSDETYRAAVSVVPLPKAIVTVEAAADRSGTGPHGPAHRLIGEVVDTCGPGGGPSPHVRLGDRAEDPAAPHLRLAVHPDGYTRQSESRGATTSIAVDGAWIRILRADGTPLTADVPGVDDRAVRRAVAIVEHVARWEQIRRLEVPGSALADAVHVELFEAEIGETCLPVDRRALVSTGGYDLPYVSEAGGYVHPRVFIQLTNTADRPLYVALIDLTDQFACRTGLFPTERLAAAHTVSVSTGAPVPVTLPANRTVEPEALARDWLKLVVSESDFDASAFQLNALDEPAVPRAATRAATTSTLERLARRALTRDIGASGAAVPAPQWAARTIPIVTRVPAR